MKTARSFKIVHLVLFIISFIVVLASAAVIWIVNEAERTIALESERASSPAIKAGSFTVSEGLNLDRHSKSGWSAILSTRNARDIASHQGNLYFATEGGLLKFAPDGTLLSHYTHFNGLPSNRLTCLLSDGNSLILGSENGLTVIRGNVISVYQPKDGSTFKVSTLMALDDRILVGTSGSGLFTFDGTSLGRELQQYPGADFQDITALTSWKGELVVGTRNKGIFLLRGASFTNITSKEKLPDNHVTALSDGENLGVGTIAGYCEVTDDLAVLPSQNSRMIAALAHRSSQLIAGTLDGQLIVISGRRQRSQTSFGDKDKPVVVNRIATVDDRTWVLTSDGAWQLEGFEPQKFEFGIENALSDNHIAAMTIDSVGRLWVGYFDRGVDVFSREMDLVKRFDDPLCRTVKSLYYDDQEGAVYLGGSKGLVRFDQDFNRQSWSTGDGLIGNEVNHICRTSHEELAVGTGSGLSFINGGDIKSIYAFHGLTNNRVFSLQPLTSSGLGSNSPLLAVGTLGGVSLVADYQVVDRITPENSDLPVHWVTALAEYEGGLLIGTYGGGLRLRDATGTMLNIPEVTGDFELNPNALLVQNDVILAGTLDRGILIYDRNEARWRFHREGLSSANITAFAADENNYYIGSDNGLVIIEKGSFNP